MNSPYQPSVPAWHAEQAEACFHLLDTTPAGLSTAEAKRRLAEYGPNRLPEASSRCPFWRFLCQFHDVLIYVLIAAAMVTALLQHWLDTTVILAVVLLNALIGFVQEGRAEQALDAIGHLLSPSAIVLREGRQQRIPVQSLVPGDVVLLQAGDKVPADLRLFHVIGLQIQEAVLIGESQAMEKGVTLVAPAVPLGDRRCMAYSGTLVTRGQGRGIVVATAAHTEIGRIRELVAETQAVATPLLRQMAQFGRWLTAAILGVAGLTFFLGTWLRDYSAGRCFWPRSAWRWPPSLRDCRRSWPSPWPWVYSV